MLANAGIASYGEALEHTDATWREFVDINMTGVWHTVRTAVPLIIE